MRLTLFTFCIVFPPKEWIFQSFRQNPLHERKPQTHYISCHCPCNSFSPHCTYHKHLKTTMCCSTKSDRSNRDGFHSWRENWPRHPREKMGNQSKAMDHLAKVLFAARRGLWGWCARCTAALHLPPQSCGLSSFTDAKARGSVSVQLCVRFNYGLLKASLLHFDQYLYNFCMIYIVLPAY